MGRLLYGCRCHESSHHSKTLPCRVSKSPHEFGRNGFNFTGICFLTPFAMLERLGRPTGTSHHPPRSSNATPLLPPYPSDLVHAIGALLANERCPIGPARIFAMPSSPEQAEHIAPLCLRRQRLIHCRYASPSVPVDAGHRRVVQSVSMNAEASFQLTRASSNFRIRVGETHTAPGIHLVFAVTAIVGSSIVRPSPACRTSRSHASCKCDFSLRFFATPSPNFRQLMSSEPHTPPHPPASPSGTAPVGTSAGVGGCRRW